MVSATDWEQRTQTRRYWDNSNLLSDAANLILNKNSVSWQEQINLLIEQKFYPDAILCISSKLSSEQNIEWISWYFEEISPLPPELTSDSKILNDDTLQRLAPENPLLWLEAAIFWQEQFYVTKENDLADLAKEAVTSAILLIIQQHKPQARDYLKILKKGLTLFI